MSVKLSEYKAVELTYEPFLLFYGEGVWKVNQAILQYLVCVGGFWLITKC